LAYGERAAGGVIGPRESLIFVVDRLEVACPARIRCASTHELQLMRGGATYAWPDRGCGSGPGEAVAGRQGAGGFPLAVAFGNRLPLVVLLLTRGDRDLDLGITVEEVQRQRHDGGPVLAGHLAGQLVDLAAVEQQLAGPAGRMIGPGPV